MQQRSQVAYQMAAADGATQAGLLVVVYNNVAKDLLCAAEAIRQQDVQRRCAASKHALLLLGHVESWLADMEEAKLVSHLKEFYGMLRARILQLQATPDDGSFEELARFVLDAASAWQHLQDRVLHGQRQRAVSEEWGETEKISFHV